MNDVLPQISVPEPRTSKTRVPVLDQCFLYFGFSWASCQTASSAPLPPRLPSGDGGHGQKGSKERFGGTV